MNPLLRTIVALPLAIAEAVHRANVFLEQSVSRGGLPSVLVVVMVPATILGLIIWFISSRT